MKTTLIIVGAVLIVLGVLQSFVIKTTKDTEEQMYEVLEKRGAVEIRAYAPAILASVTMNASKYKEISSPGFRNLAGYIFGGNETGESISMTSPVHMEMSETSSTMSFVMPAGYSMDDLPTPNNGEINIHEAPAKIVAVIQFDGFANDEKIQMHQQILAQALTELDIKHTGKYSFLGYNPPYQLSNRRNEVVVELIDFK